MQEAFQTLRSSQVTYPRKEAHVQSLGSLV